MFVPSSAHSQLAFGLGGLLYLSSTAALLVGLVGAVAVPEENWLFLQAMLVGVFGLPPTAVFMLVGVMPTETKIVFRAGYLVVTVVYGSGVCFLGITGVLISQGIGSTNYPIDSMNSTNSTSSDDSNVPGRCGDPGKQFPCSHVAPVACLGASLSLLVCAIATALLRKLRSKTIPTRAALEASWLSMSRLFFHGGLLIAIFLVAVAASGIDNFLVTRYPVSDPRSSSLWALVVLSLVLTGSAMGSSHIRVRAQAWLVSRGESVAKAAAVAALLGGHSSAEVKSTADEHFRALRVTDLTEDDLVTNKPDNKLFGKTFRAKVGEVDAFVSHSWSDNAHRKWRALQTWRNEFRARAQDEPTLWLDKGCIDQDNLDVALMCLPVFLAGCRRLLLLVGETYMQRLWCVLELFVFMEMGGKSEDVDLVVLARGPVEAARLRQSLTHFDVREALCYLESDRQRLLGAIESGYSNLERFNVSIHRMLKVALHAHVAAEEHKSQRRLSMAPGFASGDDQGNPAQAQQDLNNRLANVEGKLEEAIALLQRLVAAQLDCDESKEVATLGPEEPGKGKAKLQ